MTLVSKDMTLADVIGTYQDTREIFITNGLKEENMTDAFLSAATVQTFMTLRGLNPEIFLKLINDAALACAEVKQLYTDELPPVPAEYLGYIVCPMKQLYKEELEKALADSYKKTGEKITAFVPMGCGGTDQYENLWKEDSIDALPDVIASMGFGDYFRGEFRKKFLDTGMFASVQAQPVPEPFASAGIADPKGIYTIYATSVYIMLIDHKKLGNLPVPETWMDLTKPIYKNMIIAGGHDDEINEVLLMHLYQEGGDQALKDLAPNVQTLWHASQMAKAAGSSMKTGAAIYILPWFFASTCPNMDHASIVFPKDGGLLSPMYMLVKKDKKGKMKAVTDFMTGKVMGDLAAATLFPSLHPQADNKFPAGTKLKWLGWDFVHKTDMKEYADMLNKKFMGYRKAAGIVDFASASNKFARAVKGFKASVARG